MQNLLLPDMPHCYWPYHLVARFAVCDVDTPPGRLVLCAPLACCRRLDRLPCVMENNCTARNAAKAVEQAAAGPMKERSLVQYVIDLKQGALGIMPAQQCDEANWGLP